MNYNDKKLDIKFLTSNGFNILEIDINGDGNTNFFKTDDFEPPSIAAVSSAPYMQFSGIDITEFLANSVFNQGNTEMYRNSFQALINKETISNFKFSDKNTWRYFN